MTTEELNKIDKCRHLLPEPAPEVVGKLIEQMREIERKLNAAMATLESVRKQRDEAVYLASEAVKLARR